MAKGAPSELECTAGTLWDLLSFYSILLTYGSWGRRRRARHQED